MRKSVFLAVLLAATANLFWAANAIVGKVVVASVPAFTLSQFRWFVALAILLPYGLPKIKAQWPWYRLNWKRLLLLSILSVTFYNTLQYWALEYTAAINVGSMLALMPLAISIASWLYGGRKLSIYEWLTTLVAVAGALLVITKGEFSLMLQAQGQWQGLVLMILAITSWALYSVYLKQTPHEQINAIGLLTFFVLVGSVFIMPFWFYDMATSIISLMCWNQAIRYSDATVAGLLVTTAPLFNAILSMIFLDASIAAVQWLGIAVVAIGVALTLLLSKLNPESALP
ncbi:MAG: DMT family transporter [Reinekea sp.]